MGPTGRGLAGPLQGGDHLRRGQGHRHTAEQQGQGQQQRTRNQQPRQRPHQIAVQIAQGPPAEAADHRETHGKTRCRRDEHQELDHPQLGEVAQAGLGHQVLLVGVGQKRDRGVQGQVRPQACKAEGVEPGGLQQQQHQRHEAEQAVAHEQRQQVAHGRVGRAARITDPAHQSRFERTDPAVPGRLRPVADQGIQVPTEGGRREHGQHQGDSGHGPGGHPPVACDPQRWV
jgi:hypothetical protein